MLFSFFFFVVCHAVSFLPDEFLPKNHVAYKLAHAQRLRIDGRLDDAAWREVAWTDSFVDIATNVPPRLRTRAKVRWDDSFLYVGALLDESQIWATQTKRNSVIFDDNDFEIFVDPDASTHYYKEFEMNALNTIWTLVLNKPYINGGNPVNTNFAVKSAVFINGTLNDPTAKDFWWSVEVALPFSEYVVNCSVATAPPRVGDIWRINFSRVEHNVTVVNGSFVVDRNAPVDNWVWSPQHSVNMHLPERWGFLLFADAAVNQTTFRNNAEWPLRVCLAQVFYAESLFVSINGYFVDDVAQLALPRNCLDGSLGVAAPRIAVPVNAPYSFRASIDNAAGTLRGFIDQSRLFTFA